MQNICVWMWHWNLAEKRWTAYGNAKSVLRGPVALHFNAQGCPHRCFHHSVDWSVVWWVSRQQQQSQGRRQFGQFYVPIKQAYWWGLTSSFSHTRAFIFGSLEIQSLRVHECCVCPDGGPTVPIWGGKKENILKVIPSRLDDKMQHTIFIFSYNIHVIISSATWTPSCEFYSNNIRAFAHV